MMLDIELDQVTVKYGDFEAVKGITCKLAEGKIYGLLGRNGAGKTTLLSLLASFHEPTFGSVKIGGKTPFENANIMQNVAFVYDVDYSMETEKVEKLMAITERYRPHFDREYANQLIKNFKLPVERPLKDLSKGMQSAFNVTVGLASRSPVTIFDEAYLGMDAPTREIFYKELLEDQARHPRTIILSTHLVSEMDYLFEEVLMINKGSLMLHDEYERLLSKGASITGKDTEVDEFTTGMEKLSEQTLGSTKSVMIYGEMSEKQRNEAKRRGLEVGPVSLQDLFIRLTSEEDDHE
ncbi:ATP-binding cassette domain-containing protein [Evansella halocellulosilytica]|uniref:ATP-binding cassette domain-containing protein n=1 Tax=Evansella halocellulosilytica TaxID=2011013 RepID=UPI000BB6B9F9|nr:ABC transporter ATP-binding protein [Evansella halocellulosilytica]